MIPPELSNHESVRLAALYRLLMLDKKPGLHYQEIVDYAAIEFNVPMCMITFVNLEHQWFRAKRGFSASVILRSLSFCGHAILHKETFLVSDTLNDARFYDNPLVTQHPYIRSYAGAPLQVDNLGIGTLCIMDIRPRYFSPVEILLLEKIRDAALSELLSP